MYLARRHPPPPKTHQEDNCDFKMATNTAVQSGYDYQFIEEPSDDLKCLICLCVARDPQQHGDGGCGKIFCTNCIKRHKKIDDKCPNCRIVMNTFRDARSKQFNVVHA